MNIIFRATCISLLGLATGSVGFLGCSPTESTTTDGGPAVGDGAPGSEGGGGGGEGGGGGDGGDGDGGGGDGAVVGPGGGISVTQTIPLNHYGVSAGFANRVAPGPAAGIACVSTTAGTCTALVCTFPVSDGTPPPAPIPGLNAGTITVSATGAAGPAVLTYGPIGDAGFAGYKGVSATGQFFVPGAMVTATGAGGADLPAFGAESVVAPGEITMTSPACMPGGCPDLDRTTDLALAWTGGGAGKVTADLSTSSETTSTSIFCTFAAAGGTGTIPSTLLTKLGKAGDPGISGIESFIPSNEVSFTVGAATTTFSVQAGGAQSLMTVSN